MLVPRAASMEEIPRRAISEDVSKPRPNKIPRGYIFHGLTESARLLHTYWKLCLPVNKLEHLPKNTEHDSSALDLPRLVLLTDGKVQDLLHLPVELVQNVRIHKTQENQKRRTDRGANNATDGAEAVKARRNRCCCSSYDNGGNDDNAVFVRMPASFDFEGVAHVECPKEKNVPTVTGFWLLASSLRVIKSMACRGLAYAYQLLDMARTEIWSASKACLKPSV